MIMIHPDTRCSTTGTHEPPDVVGRDDSPHRSSEAIHVVLIDPDPDHARKVMDMAVEARAQGLEHIAIDWARDLAGALPRLGREQVVLFALSLSDGAALASLEQLNRRTDSPVVILGQDYDRKTLERMGIGGQHAVGEVLDYLVKGRFDGEILLRSIRNVLERHRLLCQLRQAQKMEVVGRLASGIAHDFSNIVTAISLHAEHLRRHLLPTDPLLERARDIQQAARRGSRLTNQLLAFSCRQEWHPEVVDLNVTVRDVGAFYHRVLGENITVTESLAGGLDRVRADPNQLEQVIMNLVTNAREAMPHGGRLELSTCNVRIETGQTVGAGIVLQPGKYVQLVIEDTGCGMDSATLNHIFDPSFTSEERGRGFGLSTVYGIVRRSGGHISVESRRHRGTRFTVLLPAAEGPVSVAPEASEIVTLGGTETILLVEDDADLRPLIAEALKQQGYDVVEAGCAKSALAAARERGHALDLVIADFIMPDSRAPELIADLQSHRPGLKVLFMSGYVDEDTFSGNAEMSRVPFIEKPFRTSELSFRVREVLDEEPPEGNVSM